MSAAPGHRAEPAGRGRGRSPSKSIATRTGDAGETGLLYGGRVPKDDLHTEAYGALDEAISALGLARATESDPGRAERLLAIQRELFTVGAELATGPGERAKLEKHFATVTPAMVAALDARLADLEARVPLAQAFVIPGGSPVAAALDLARSLVRRAERRSVSLQRAGLLENPEVLRYLNRLSDVLFMLAREAELGATTVRDSLVHNPMEAD
ncbi:MAG TPA: cob(I)yrinic acid a,c-diamide adenosyltransferase [Candidatus Binatia bacterium]|nr:cob(I)yrinic acid a,c-diamide adenosyltransferase [Candidatus Binatia bacterium]